jgi:hypothetical protein
MAAVSNMPDMPWQEVAVGARHRVSLEARFQRQKGASKLLNGAFYVTLLCKINQLCRPGVARSAKDDRYVHNLRLDFHMTQRTLAPVRFLDGLTGLAMHQVTLRCFENSRNVKVSPWRLCL